LAVHDADIHLSCVQIDSAVELGGGCIILHSLTQ
jgi:tetrahydrodipicolinate N-succinyltransferase